MTGQPPDPEQPAAPDEDRPAVEPNADTARVPTEPWSPAAGLISAEPVGWGGAAPEPPGGRSGPDPAAASTTPGPASAPGRDGTVISGVFTRVVAYTIDISLLTAINVAVESWAGVFTEEPDMTRALVVAIGLVTFDLLYFVLFWTSGLHATLGMRLMRLQIFSVSDASSLSFNDAILRWLALTGAIAILALVPSVAPSIGLLSMLWLIVLLATTAMHPLRQGLHDRWARSVIVQPAPGGSGLAIVGCLVLIVVLVVVLPVLVLAVYGDRIRDVMLEVSRSV
jgi:uncharacterized RDD family membrane protein YckC